MEKPKPEKIYDVQELLSYYNHEFPDRKEFSLRGVVEGEECAGQETVITLYGEYFDKETSEIRKWIISEFADKELDGDDEFYGDVKIRIWW